MFSSIAPVCKATKPVKILKGDTPGQEVKESALNDFIEKGGGQ